MPEKIVTCSECQGMFDIGHIPPGQDVKCPDCGNALIVEEGAAPAKAASKSRPNAPAVGSSPRAPAAGSSPRVSSSSQPAASTGPRRSAPRMRRVMRTRGSGGGSSSHMQSGDDEERSGGRLQAAPRKGGNPALIIGGVVAVVVVLAVVFLSGKSADQKKHDQFKKGTDVAETKSPPKSTLPVTPASPPASQEMSFSSFTTPPPKEFKVGSDNRPVTGWPIDEAKKSEIEKKLKESYAKGGDASVREEIVKRGAEAYPLVCDRLRSDDEAIAKEAATVGNTLYKILSEKYNFWFAGKKGADIVTDLAAINDPERRIALFNDMRRHCQGVQDTINNPANPNPPTPFPMPGTPATPATPAASPSSSVSIGHLVDVLRRGGEERDAAMRELSANKPRSVRELVRCLDTEDRLLGIAMLKALNELTGAAIDVPKVGEYNGATVKKKWEDWVSANQDKLR
jgi:hypothetical protein